MGWIMMMSRSRALDFLRQRTRRRDHEEQLALYLESEVKNENTSESVVHAFQENSIVQTAISELSFAQQQVLGLSFFQGLSHSEIATLLLVPLGTVKSDIRRGLNILQQKCRELGEHHGWT